LQPTPPEDGVHVCDRQTAVLLGIPSCVPPVLSMIVSHIRSSFERSAWWVVLLQAAGCRLCVDFCDERSVCWSSIICDMSSVFVPLEWTKMVVFVVVKPFVL
jgi:hypothetical protein